MLAHETKEIKKLTHNKITRPDNSALHPTDRQISQLHSLINQHADLATQINYPIRVFLSAGLVANSLGIPDLAELLVYNAMLVTNTFLEFEQVSQALFLSASLLGTLAPCFCLTVFTLWKLSLPFTRYFFPNGAGLRHGPRISKIEQ